MLVKQLKFILFIILSGLPFTARSQPITPKGPSSPPPIIYPKGQQLYDQYPWFVDYYYGITASDGLTQILTGNFHRWPEHIQSIELGRTLDRDNLVRRFFSPLVGVVQIV